MNPEPLVSIVTPSYNMGRFIRETIESVLCQDYERIEYLVVDGGSTDDTLDILRSYGERFRWISEPDRGQADAINKGFRMTAGEIFTFLNADDTYEPGAVCAAVRQFAANPGAAAIYGEANYVAEDGRVLSRYPVEDPELLDRYCCICQPASFVRRDSFPGVDAGLHYALDYDLWLRMASQDELIRIPCVLANSRMHMDNKTLGRRREVLCEAIQVVKRNTGYAGFEPVYGYACYLLDRKDQFFETVKPSAGKFALTWLAGLRHNPGQPIRWTRECIRALHGYFGRTQPWLPW